MSWFSKKDKVPELPDANVAPSNPSAAPSLPDLPLSADEKLPELPSFPDNSSQNNSNTLPSFPNNAFGDKKNQDTVKSAVSSSGEKEVIEELPKDFNFENEDKTEKRTLEISQSQKEKITKQAEPIFVRIDKFQESKKDFIEIKTRLKDIENVLRKIKDVKVKEDAEIETWTQNIETLKARLSEIDSNIFDKL